MNGIENIEKRILDEANAKADAIIKDAQQKAEAITSEYEEKIRKETTLINEKNVLLLQDIKMKARQADEMERRKRLSGKRFEIVSEVFEKAQERIMNLDDEKYLDLLVTLSSNSMKDNLGGELLFNKADREKFGQRVVDRINAAVLSQKADSAKKAVTSVVDDIKEGNMPNVSRVAEDVKAGFSKKMVTLSDETADITGGVVVRRGKIEYNCDIAVIIRILSEEMAPEVHNKLFPKGA